MEILLGYAGLRESRACKTLNPKTLNPEALPGPQKYENNGLYGHYYGCRAVILHTFGV